MTQVYGAAQEPADMEHAAADGKFQEVPDEAGAVEQAGWDGEEPPAGGGEEEGAVVYGRSEAAPAESEVPYSQVRAW